MKKHNFLSPMHKATRQLGLHFERRTADRELSPQEGHLLTYLRVYAPAPIGDLIRIFGMKGSTMTSMLDRLAGLGLTERTLNPDDRRSFVVSLTAHGKSVADEVQKFVEQTERDINKRVSKRDIEGFDAVMQAIAEVTGVVVRPERKK
jgi:MarR family transcriptional regulator, organic hydroperoxide resistance regulator